LKPAFKNIQPRANPPEADPNLPKCSIPRQKINVDNKAPYRYYDNYWFRLMEAAICCAAAEADTQFTIFV
jgi:hypothetical protein